MKGRTRRILLLRIQAKPPAEHYSISVYGADHKSDCLHTVEICCEFNARVEYRNFRGRDARSHALAWARQTAVQKTELVKELQHG